TQPGHWLLLIEGTSILLTWLGQAVAFLAVGDQARNISYSSAAEVPSCIVSAILYAVALQKLSGESRLWKATLWLLLLEYIFAAFVLGATALSILSASDFLSLWKVEYTCSPAILLGGLPIVAFGDPRRRQTDFLHWTGVAA